MAGESLFQKIKRNVDAEKNKKVSGEARLSQLGEEQGRIFKHVQEEVDAPVSTVEDVEKICEDLKNNIESDISKMVALLREEGIEV